LKTSTRKPITKQEAKNIASAFTFGTLALALVLLAINWQLALGIAAAFVSGWIASAYWFQAQRIMSIKVNGVEVGGHETRFPKRPTRDSVRETIKQMDAAEGISRFN
jgi:hypothetical protein